MVLFAKAYFAIDMDKKFIRALLDLGKASHSDRLFAIHIHGCVAWAPWTVVHRRLGLDGPPLKLDFVDDAMLLKSSLKSFDGSLEGYDVVV